ncbi:MAG: 50S ribosomal protein L21e [Methanothrix sp.]|nr:50S ribosomal protein L21e [Methanothrix sp.]
MVRHHGMRKKTRDKLSKTVRTRGISPVVRAIQEFEPGSKVHVLIDPSIHKGMPHPRFHGKTGEITGKRGRAFVLTITDGDATKTLIALPEHLVAQKK